MMRIEKHYSPLYKREQLLRLFHILQERGKDSTSPEALIFRKALEEILYRIHCFSDLITSYVLRYSLAYSIKELEKRHSVELPFHPCKSLHTLPLYGDHIDLLVMPFEELPLHLHGSERFPDSFTYDCIMKWRLEEGV